MPVFKFPCLITKTEMGWTETAPATSGDFFGGLMSMVEYYLTSIFFKDPNARKREAPFLGIALQGETFRMICLRHKVFQGKIRFFQVRGLLLVHPLNSRRRHGVAGRANIMLDSTHWTLNFFPRSKPKNRTARTSRTPATRPRSQTQPPRSPTPYRGAQKVRRRSVVSYKTWHSYATNGISLFKDSKNYFH